jgi:hypothetical protein
MSMLPTNAFWKSDPFHTPAWRWDRAGALVATRKRASRHDDSITRSLVQFRSALIEARSTRQQKNFMQRCHPLSAAYLVYHSAGPQRDELEARLLTGRPLSEIAGKTGISADVIQAYADAFFDVLDCLTAGDWLMFRVVQINSRDHRPLSEGQIWKYWAVAGGPIILDLLVDDYLGRPDRQSPNRHEQAEKARFLAREQAEYQQSGAMTAEGFHRSEKLFHVRDTRRGSSPEDKMLALQHDCLRSSLVRGSKPKRYKSKSPAATPTPNKTNQLTPF